MHVPQLWEDIDKQRGLLVLDVDGSDWSIPASIKRGNTVIAFEQLPSNVRLFMQTVRNNGIESKTTKLEPKDARLSWPLDRSG